jgi:hypothetical protein
VNGSLKDIWIDDDPLGTSRNKWRSERETVTFRLPDGVEQ